MDYNLNLLLNKPIPIKNIGVIYQPTINDMLDYGLEEYNKLLLPYTVSLDMLQLTAEQKMPYRNYDLLLMDNASNKKLLTHKENGIEISYFELFKISLEFFFKERVEYIPSSFCFKIGETGLVHRDNFDELADIILKINSKEKPKYEQEVEIQVKNENNRSLLEELKRQRKQNQEKNNSEVGLKQIINVVVHNKYSKFSYIDVLNMTYYQLINSYMCIMQEDNYYTFMDYKTSGQFEIKQDIKHWSELVK